MNKRSVNMEENIRTSAFMDLLTAKNKKPEDVANALGVSLRAVFYWIAGTREPRLTIAQIQALCILLDCSVHELPAVFGPQSD